MRSKFLFCNVKCALTHELTLIQSLFFLLFNLSNLARRHFYIPVSLEYRHMNDDRLVYRFEFDRLRK